MFAVLTLIVAGKTTCVVSPHSHGGTDCGSSHTPFLASRALFSNSSSTVSPRRIFGILQAQSLPDEFLIKVHAIGQEYISNRASILVEAMSQKRDLLPEDKISGSVLGE